MMHEIERVSVNQFSYTELPENPLFIKTLTEGESNKRWGVST